VVKRELFSTPMAAEFFAIKSLESQIGEPKEDFGFWIAKELLDNALDSTEAGGAEPKIWLQLQRDDKYLVITVTDNGVGLSEETIRQIIDFEAFASDKAVYRSPTRGQQGHAWKAIVGITHSLGDTRPIVIESQGLRHVITVKLDDLGLKPNIDYPKPEKLRGRRGSTKVTVTVPLKDQDKWDGHWLIRQFAIFNPHAVLILQADSESPSRAGFYKSAPPGWTKPKPDDPQVAWYYDDASFSGLVASYIYGSRHGGSDVPIGEFIAGFKGLSGSQKQKQVRSVLPRGITHLSDFGDQMDRVPILLQAMQAHSKPPTAAALSRVPEEHLHNCFDRWYGVRRWWYRDTPKNLVDDRGMPWVIQVVVAETKGPGNMYWGINYSPVARDPLSNTVFDASGLKDEWYEEFEGIHEFLDRMDASPDGRRNRAALVHLITPVARFLEKGKTTLEVR
jgi:hypothetical protein